MIFRICFCFSVWCCAYLWLSPALAQTAPTVLTFRQTLDRVRTNSPALRVERLNIDATRANEITANLRANPVLNNQTLIQVNSSYFPEGAGLVNRRNRQFWLQATKEFDIYNKRGFRTQLAQANTRLAERSVAETERNLLFDAANRWLDTQYARVQFDLLQRAKLNVDSLVEINKIRLKDLAITTTDLTRTQLLADQYELQIATARQEAINRLAELRLVLATTDSLTVSPTDAVIAPLGGLDSLLRQAEQNRTDVRAAQANLEAARRNVALQQVLARPRNEAGLIWNPQNAVPYLGIFLTLEVPFYNRNQGNIQQSKVLQEQAVQVIDLTQLRVRSEVRLAWNSFETSRQNLIRYGQILRQSDQVLNTIRYAYLRGATTLIDYLEAQRFWFDTQTAYNQAVYQNRQNYIRLLFATGNL
jgi:outer membrane protein, heavy metal efflux system